MKKKVLMMLVVGVLLSAENIASADIVQGINLDFVSIGNAGNPHNPLTGIGAVSYDYRIGRDEVTIAQWKQFTTAAGAPTGNLSDAYDYNEDGTYTDPTSANRISWYEAAQFCNYLTSGDKSQGAYQFSGNNANPGDFLGIDRSSALSDYGTVYVIPTEDEWYKAAYYKPDNSGYSLYANGIETIPPPDDGWNYYYNGHGPYSAPWERRTGTEEQNGTYDMMGNVWDWTERYQPDGIHRIVRGGSYYFGDHIHLSSEGGLSSLHPTYDGYLNDRSYDNIGFRVVEIPELVLVVEIDIKPGSYPNAINLGSHGLTPVAIFSMVGFDATSIEPNTVNLAGAPVAIRGKDKFMAHEEDVDEDGLVDLVVQVVTADINPALLQQDGDVIYAVLTGNTSGGEAIEGEDEIIIVPPK